MICRGNFLKQSCTLQIIIIIIIIIILLRDHYDFVHVL